LLRVAERSTMKIASTMATALTAGLLLTACGGDVGSSDGTSGAPSGASPSAEQPPSPDDAGTEAAPVEVPPEDDDVAASGRPIQYWPGGVLPYSIDDSLAASVGVIQVALGTINRATDIELRPRADGERDYVVFRAARGTSSRSSLGKRGGEQYIDLSPSGARDPRIVMHEVGHAIGLVHEQQRPDRDAYVTVRYECMEDRHRKQFDVNPRIRDEQERTPFDFDSIMLYGSQIFAKGKTCPAMVRRSDGAALQGFGGSVGLSPGMVRLFDTIAASP